MTDIEWTDETWNPIVGCSVVSPGCTNCYAMRKAWRLAHMGKGTAHYRNLTEKKNGKIVWTGAMRAAPDSLLKKPMRWKKLKKIFVNSMGDLFHEAIPDALIDRVFAVMALCPQHTFQILTKRAERMREYIKETWQPAPAHSISGLGMIDDIDVPAETKGDTRLDQVQHEADVLAAALGLCNPDDDSHWDESGSCKALKFDWPLKNVWLGVSAEDQKRAEERIPLLLDTPAAKRFVSCEPLTGPIDLTDIEAGVTTYNALEGCGLEMNGAQPFQVLTKSLDWIIAGGESGPGARPAHPQWFRDLRDQCQQTDVPFFFKQWGSWAPAWEMSERFTSPPYKSHIFGVEDLCVLLVGKKAAGALLDGCEHREFPNAERATSDQGKADRPSEGAARRCRANSPGGLKEK